MPRRFRCWVLIMALLIGVATPGAAHHSGALFYDPDGGISITGTVTKFSFRNPHAIIELAVDNADGEQARWIAETSAPSALRRRGWSQGSLAIGEEVTLEGIRARDGPSLPHSARSRARRCSTWLWSPPPTSPRSPIFRVIG